MKNKMMIVMLSALSCIMLTGCLQNANPNTQENTDKTSEAVSATYVPVEGTVPERVNSEEEPQDTFTPEGKLYDGFVSRDGWFVTYSPKEYDAWDVGDGVLFERSDNYFAGPAALAVCYYPGKMPKEVLYEKAGYDQEAYANVKEGYFDGVRQDMWSFTAKVDNDTERATHVVTEFNGGTLLVSLFLESLDVNYDEDHVEEAFQEFLHAIDFEDFQPQTQFSFVPGEYQAKDGDGKNVTLYDNHTGVMDLDGKQQSFTWTSTDFVFDDDEKFMYTIEGEYLYVDLSGDSSKMTEYEKVNSDSQN